MKKTCKIIFFAILDLIVIALLPYLVNCAKLVSSVTISCCCINYYKGLIRISPNLKQKLTNTSKNFIGQTNCTVTH